MDIIALILSGIFGLIFGSFLNVVIYRVPLHQSISYPPSHCPKCNHQLSWFHNIPILSYLFLGGKCAYCKDKISPQYILVEISNCLLWLLCVYIFWDMNVVYALLSMAICSILLVIFWIDIEHKLIFDRFQIMLLILGVALIFFDSRMLWWEHLIGALVGGGIFLAIYYIAYLVLHKEAMGGGDVKLMAVCGLILGWKNVLLAIVIGAICATIVLGLYAIIHKSNRNTEFPFAPFLVFGTYIALFYGQTILDFYFNLF